MLGEQRDERETGLMPVPISGNPGTHQSLCTRLVVPDISVLKPKALPRCDRRGLFSSFSLWWSIEWLLMTGYDCMPRRHSCLAMALPLISQIKSSEFLW